MTPMSWGALPFQNGGAKKDVVRAALFGNGTKAGGLVSKVLIGGTGSKANPYLSINAVLKRLGVVSSAAVGHQNHFHIYLRPPELAPIDGKSANLLSASDAFDGNLQSELTLPVDQGLAIDPIPEETEMLESLFIPYLPVDDAYLTRPQVVMVAQAPSGAGGMLNTPAVKPDMILSDCDDVQTPDNPDGQLGGSLQPAGTVHNYWYSKYRKDIDVSDARIVVIEGPRHGEIEDGRRDEDKASNKKFSLGIPFVYSPKPGFLGIDQVTFMVEVAGKRIKVVTKLYVVPIADSKGVYCFGKIKRIGGNADSGGFTANLSEDWLRSVGMDDMLARALSGVSLTFADLGNAVGQTVDEGGNATITLDDNAAGHNWFIDATPDQNEEFLPTSNPNQWIAKAGTEAANKMDLLSVLLHEYGHVLGIEHSADGNDFMAATLQPGVRRLPSTEELSLMAQLAGQARLALDGSGTPDAPNPALPLGTLGFALLGRLRRTDYGGWTIGAQSAQLLPQYQIAINPTLQNGDLTGTTAWQASGNVEFDRAGGQVLH